MTLDDTLKFSMQRMTAYQNVEKDLEIIRISILPAQAMPENVLQCSGYPDSGYKTTKADIQQK